MSIADNLLKVEENSNTIKNHVDAAADAIRENSVLHKNLMDYNTARLRDNYTKGMISFIENGLIYEGNYYFYFDVQLEKDKTYILSANYNHSVGDDVNSIYRLMYADGSFDGAYFNAPCTAKQDVVSIFIYGATGTNANYTLTMTNIMLEEGTVAHEYTPYKGGDYAIPLQEFPQRISEVYNVGKASGKEDFWDNYQDNGNRTDYGYAFAGVGWTDEIYDPKYSIIINPPIATNRLTSLFQNSGVTVTKQPIIIMTSATGNASFYMATNLKEITELRLDTDMGTTSSSFNGCTKLESINITGDGKFLGTMTFKNSQYLTKDSIISIIGALSPNVTGQTLTLSKVAVNREFGINVDDVSTWGEGSEYRKLVDTKPNWSIAHG